MISQLHFLNIKRALTQICTQRSSFLFQKTELVSSQRYSLSTRTRNRTKEGMVSVKNREQVREKFRREDSLINSSGVAQLICFGLRMPLVKRADKINETGIRKEIHGREAKAHRKRAKNQKEPEEQRRRGELQRKGFGWRGAVQRPKKKLNDRELYQK